MHVFYISIDGYNAYEACCMYVAIHAFSTHSPRAYTLSVHCISVHCITCTLYTCTLYTYTLYMYDMLYAAKRGTSLFSYRTCSIEASYTVISMCFTFYSRPEVTILRV